MSPRAHERIAVVGSGLAGLAAAWLLGREREVVLHESYPGGGMGAHSIRLDSDATRSLIDVPLRVFTPSYYPTLCALYDHVGIDTAPVDYAASFSTLGAGTYYRYFNMRLGRHSIPMVDPTIALGRAARRITADLVRLHRHAPRDLASGRLASLTFGEYLHTARYSTEFVERFALPAYASICTCRTASVREYPAETIVGYMVSGVTTTGVRRAIQGTDDVMRRLSATAANVRFGHPVRRIVARESGVDVVDAEGTASRFDHVVLATRADQGAALLEGDDQLRSLLSRIPHEESRVVVHHDARLAPRDRRQWSPVNFVSSDTHDSPMATIWLNRVQPSLRRAAPIFQTWNPIIEPAEGTIVSNTVVARPLVTLDSAAVPEALAQLHRDPARRIWAAGSYVERGVPLLEAAAASAVRVARTLGVSVPFRVPT
jgi:predicted NAD/FAD-binding protein